MESELNTRDGLTLTLVDSGRQPLVAPDPAAPSLLMRSFLVRVHNSTTQPKPITRVLVEGMVGTQGPLVTKPELALVSDGVVAASPFRDRANLLPNTFLDFAVTAEITDKNTGRTVRTEMCTQSRPVLDDPRNDYLFTLSVYHGEGQPADYELLVRWRKSKSGEWALTRSRRKEYFMDHPEQSLP